MAKKEICSDSFMADCSIILLLYKLDRQMPQIREEIAARRQKEM